MNEVQEKTLKAAEATLDITDAAAQRNGDFATVAAISQMFKGVIAYGIGARNSKGLTALTDTQREAMESACLSYARILAGDPNCAEHWAGASGYNFRAMEH